MMSTNRQQAIGSPLSSSACTGGLFSDSTTAGTIDFSKTPGLLRMRTVLVDVAAIARSAENRTSLTLNLFDDTCVVAEVSALELDNEGRLIWTGKIQDAPDGSYVTLVAARDVVVGSVQAAGPSTYQLRYAGNNGVHAIMLVNASGYPPD